MTSKNREKRELRELQKVEPSLLPYEYWPEDIKQYNETRLEKKIQAKIPWQEQYLSALRNDEHVLGIGKAGTGKTFLAAACAAKMLQDKNIKMMVMTRPPLECGEKMGFLPGDLNEKYAPYVEPFLDGLSYILGRQNVLKMLEDPKSGKLLAIPPNFVRGRTFDNAVMLIDEAQNLEKPTMKAILTRVGQNSKMFITGDLDQIDLKPYQESGLKWWIESLRQHRPEVEIVDFDQAPVVRSAHCAWILEVCKKVQ